MTDTICKVKILAEAALRCEWGDADEWEKVAGDRLEGEFIAFCSPSLVLGLVATIEALQAEQAVAHKLDKPAQVGATIFRKGISTSTVIRCAQRLYEFEQNPPTPEQIAEGRRMLQELGFPVTTTRSTIPKGWNIEFLPKDDFHPKRIRIDSPKDAHIELARQERAPNHDPLNLLYDLAEAALTAAHQGRTQ